LVQTFSENFVVSTKNHKLYAMLVLRYMRHFSHFTSQQNKVSKSEVVEKVIPMADC